ncbi:3D domain-containing protein [Halalkalibacillus halophilus]|uniref:3D domain-containing protein n=1 Tax=Halalkalibacillus halophilus TaxID=392827 RepID=UPI0003FE5CB5|nr:3D domain-containing protein [Halalkalibacillus halophilus]
MKKSITSLVAGVLIAGAGATYQTAAAEDYQVQSGDTLWGISEEFSTSVSELKEKNELDSNLILPGQVLTIDEAKEVHEVKSGDTLWAIANEYGVSVDELMGWNSLNSDLIIVGQELAVNAANAEQPAQSSNEQATEQNQASESNSSNQSESSEQASQSESSEQSNEQASQSESSEQSNESNESTQQASNETSNSEEPAGETFTVTATAYTAECEGCSGITANGTDLRNDRNAKVIAVDPNVIPLGTKVYVEGYGEAIAADTGGAIKGNKIDLHVPTTEEAFSWGVRDVQITILD